MTLKDYTPEEITYLLDLAADLKDKKKQGVLVDSLRGKNVALKMCIRDSCGFGRKAYRAGVTFRENTKNMGLATVAPDVSSMRRSRI